MESGDELQEGPEGTGQSVDRPRTILVVEDHPVHRQMTQAVLEALGNRVTIVEDGFAAVEAAGAAAFDVIVMDRNMPRCGGDQAVRMIRAQAGPSRDAIIICHSSELPTDDNAALYDEVLEKPSTANAVRALLDRVRARIDAASATRAALRG